MASKLYADLGDNGDVYDVADVATSSARYGTVIANEFRRLGKSVNRSGQSTTAIAKSSIVDVAKQYGRWRRCLTLGLDAGVRGAQHKVLQ